MTRVLHKRSPVGGPFLKDSAGDALQMVSGGKWEVTVPLIDNTIYLEGLAEDILDLQPDEAYAGAVLVGYPVQLNDQDWTPLETEDGNVFATETNSLFEVE